MRSTDYGGRGGGPHGPSRHTYSARPNHSVEWATHGTRRPDPRQSGRQTLLDHHAMGLSLRPYANLDCTPREFDETATAEINGVVNGTASSFGHRGANRPGHQSSSPSPTSWATASSSARNSACPQARTWDRSTWPG